MADTETAPPVPENPTSPAETSPADANGTTDTPITETTAPAPDAAPQTPAATETGNAPEHGVVSEPTPPTISETEKLRTAIHNGVTEGLKKLGKLPDWLAHEVVKVCEEVEKELQKL